MNRRQQATNIANTILYIHTTRVYITLIINYNTTTTTTTTKQSK